MSSKERLMRYCMVDTQSDPESGTHPSSMKQFDLAKMLVEELKELGLTDASVDEHCYIYAHLPSNMEKSVRTVGFIAHMDTAPDFSGKDVHPVLIENYDGTDIELCPGVVTRVAQFPHLAAAKGRTLMVTDGSTLLGADDKAGIAAIMDALEYYRDHPEEKHGTIAVSFTPDEEIGEGPMFFDLKRFKADLAYTMDGGEVYGYSDETFNAAAVQVEFKGFSIHPGEAKDRMKNASAMAVKFHSSLNEAETPEHTEGREGFIHLCNMSGDVETAELAYIVRDHDQTKLQKKIHDLEAVCTCINALYGEESCTMHVKEQYHNMKEILDQHPEVSRIALSAIEELGYTPVVEPIRGGTDGAQISFMGLPCPNLGAGGGNFHGRHEYCVLEELEDAAKMIRIIATHVAMEEI